MKVLSIDPANSSGFCVMNKNKQVLDIGFFKCSTKDLGDRILEQYIFFKELILKNDFTYVVFEEFKCGKFAGAAESSYAFRGMLRMLCAELKMPYKVISISQWKQSIGIKKRLTKAQKAKLGVNANKIQIQEALKKIGYSVPEKMKNSRTGKLVKTPADSWDAIGIGYRGIEEILAS